MTERTPFKILGIDPGFARCGYGILTREGNTLLPLTYGVITTSTRKQLPERLLYLHTELQKLIEMYHPNYVGVEDLYFCKNVKTALDVGQARGVILLALIQAGLPIMHFTPLQVKQAVTSYGKADKQQVQRMVSHILRLSELPSPDDAADALAVAICCANTCTLPSEISILR